MSIETYAVSPEAEVIAPAASIYESADLANETGPTSEDSYLSSADADESDDDDLASYDPADPEARRGEGSEAIRPEPLIEDALQGDPDALKRYHEETRGKAKLHRQVQDLRPQAEFAQVLGQAILAARSDDPEIAASAQSDILAMYAELGIDFTGGAAYDSEDDDLGDEDLDDLGYDDDPYADDWSAVNYGEPAYGAPAYDPSAYAEPYGEPSQGSSGPTSWGDPRLDHLQARLDAMEAERRQERFLRDTMPRIVADAKTRLDGWEPSPATVERAVRTKRPDQTVMDALLGADPRGYAAHLLRRRESGDEIPTLLEGIPKSSGIRNEDFNRMSVEDAAAALYERSL